VLINNAGLMPIRPMSEVNTDEWDAMIDVNLKGTLRYCCRVVAFHRARQRAHHQPEFRGRHQGFCAGRDSLLRHQVRGSRFAVRVILEGLRQEIGDKIRVTSIEPGAVDSDLKFSTSGAAKETVPDFYRQAIPATSVARAIAFAIEQPGDVDIEEIVLRSTSPAFRRTEGCN
jgi:NADP-dependent 3-hydroxy acid dehydrogenase YdfG